MMKQQIKPAAAIVAIVLLVAVVIFFGSKAMHTGDLDQGQTSYTPGVPPWNDPAKKGTFSRVPGSPPSAGQPGTAPTGGIQPGTSQVGSGADAGHAPPGVTAPVIDGKGVDQGTGK